MPPIYYLNPPPNPFWDFVAGLEDHPFFRGPPPQVREARPTPPPQNASAAETPRAQPQPGMSDKSRGKQPSVEDEDPPEVDPSTIKPEPRKTEESNRERAFPFRGRGRFAEAFNDDDNKDNAAPPSGKDREQRREERQERREERRCRRDRGHGPGPNGPPPFGFAHPFFARPPWAGPDFQGPPGPPGRHHRHGPPHEHPHPHDHHRRGPPADIRDRDRRFGQGPPHRRCSPPQQRPQFDLAEFLNKLGSKLGIDLSNAAEGLGLAQDRFTAGRTTTDVNFEPRADIFENQSAYTIHLSLPGAKKEDVGVEYEGEHSVLRITGVVHRPDVDEQMMNELVVDGRKRETGVFEKAIRLGTRRDPANIDVAGINAKMTDGVLVVRIPKLAQHEQRRDVTISTESQPLAYVQPQPDYENDYFEKPVLFDADEQASVATSDVHEAPRRGEISLVDMIDNDVPAASEKKDTRPVDDGKKKTKAEEAEAEAEREKEADPKASGEQLPAYSAEAEEDDWERFSDDSGEGEYIKIDVK